MKKTSILLLLLLILNGCSTKLGHFNTITTKEVDFSKKHTKSAKKYVGKDTTSLYVIIPNKIHPDIDIAVSRVLERTNAEYMTDTNITYKFWYIPYIYGEFWYEVEGYVWRKAGAMPLN